MTTFILCTKIRTKIILVATSKERLPQLYYKEIQQCISHELSYSSIFQIGQTFSSFDGLERTKSTYETKHFCQLVKRDCRAFEAAKNRIPKRIEMQTSHYAINLLNTFASSVGNQETLISSEKEQPNLFVATVHLHWNWFFLKIIKNSKL